MKFSSTSLDGCWLIELQELGDHRGFFARTYCAREFAQIGVSEAMVQDSIGFNSSAGTLRGMHYHTAPFRQSRLVRCTAGICYMVALDLRPNSETFLKHYDIELSAKNRKAIYVGTGFALGYKTLVDCTEIYYQMTNYFDAQYERGFRWNDPAFNIQWPEVENTIIKDRDNQYPDFDVSMVEKLV